MTLKSLKSFFFILSFIFNSFLYANISQDQLDGMTQFYLGSAEIDLAPPETITWQRRELSSKEKSIKYWAGAVPDKLDERSKNFYAREQHNRAKVNWPIIIEFRKETGLAYSSGTEALFNSFKQNYLKKKPEIWINGKNLEYTDYELTHRSDPEKWEAINEYRRTVGKVYSEAEASEFDTWLKNRELRKNPKSIRGQIVEWTAYESSVKALADSNSAGAKENWNNIVTFRKQKGTAVTQSLSATDDFKNWPIERAKVEAEFLKNKNNIELVAFKNPLSQIELYGNFNNPSSINNGGTLSKTTPTTTPTSTQANTNTSTPGSAVAETKVQSASATPDYVRIPAQIQNDIIYGGSVNNRLNQAYRGFKKLKKFKEDFFNLSEEKSPASEPVDTSKTETDSAQ